MVTNTTCTTELVDTGEKRDRLGRRITPAPRRAELVEAWRSSGLTQAAFARQEGVVYSSFASWVQEARRPKRRPGRSSVRFVEAKLAMSSSAGLLEVRLVDGTVLRGAPVELAALLKALRS